MSEKIVQIGGEFGVTVRFTYKPGDAHVDFFAADVLCLGSEGPLYWSKGAESSMDDPTPDLTNAERYIDGSVKWDGCSHFYFGDENGYLHLCNQSEIAKLNETIAEIHRTCGQIMLEANQNIELDEFDPVLNSRP